MLPIVLMVFMASPGLLEANKIDCEKIESGHQYKSVCYLNYTTEISEVNATFKGLENSYVDAILFRHNKKIKFLPVKVYNKFSNLEVYLAQNASIKEISALNFERLSKLEYLDLEENQIEFIPNFCFESLISLTQIFLSTKSL